MIAVPFELAHDDNSPLDMVEDLIEAKGWKCTRQDSDFLAVEMQGQTTSFEVCMEWQEEFSALLFACSMPIAISEKNYEMATQALEHINQNMWLGHFDLSHPASRPTFRHTLLLRMIPTGIAVDIINDLLDIALAECNRFYTTFQLIQSGDARLQDNLGAAVFETIGEA